MKWLKKKKVEKKGIKIPSLEREKVLPYLGIVFIAVSAYLVGIVFHKYAWPAFLALLLYIGFYQLNRYIRTWIWLRIHFRSRDLSAIISTLLAFALIILPSSLLIRQVVIELYRIMNSLSHFAADGRFLTYLEELFWLTEIVTDYPFFWVDIYNAFALFIQDYSRYLDPNQLANWLGNLFSFIRGGLSFTLTITFDLFLIMMLLYFLFRDGPQLYRFLRDALPFPKQVADNFTNNMYRITTDVLRGNIFVAILQGSALASVLFFLGFQSALSYGVITALFSVIPVIGTAVVWLPCALYLAMIEGNYGLAIFLSVYGLSVYLALENIVKPKLLDAKLGIHPLLIFFSILGGLAEFGISGFLLGPLFLMLFKTVWNICSFREANQRDS